MRKPFSFVALYEFPVSLLLFMHALMFLTFSCAYTANFCWNWNGKNNRYFEIRFTQKIKMKENIWSWWLFFETLWKQCSIYSLHYCCFFLTLPVILIWLMMFSWYVLALALLSKLKIVEKLFFQSPQKVSQTWSV